MPYEIIQLIIMAGYPKISISCGWKHSCMIINNEVYGWGLNDRGQLGLGNNLNQNSPQKLNLRRIKKISCGDYHTMALENSGQVYAWGCNKYGQLGSGNRISQNSPQKLNLLNIKKISCGYYHTIALTHSNEIYVWGSNGSGNLGLGNNTDYDSPQMMKKCEPHFFESVRKDAHGAFSQQKLNLRNIKKISCGSAHTMALDNFGEVYAWGWNYRGQLGLGHNNDQNLPQKLKF